MTLLKAMCPDSEGTGICTSAWWLRVSALCRGSVSISGTGPRVEWRSRGAERAWQTLHFP